MLNPPAPQTAALLRTAEWDDERREVLLAAVESLLVVQSNHEWAVERFDDPTAWNVAALADATARIVDDERLADPAWSDHQGWRCALPESGAPGGPLQSAQGVGLYCVGD